MYTLEQLQGMSDGELNELSAVEVMGWVELAGGFYKEKFHYTETGILVRSVADWDPTNDMNDAMKLAKKFPYFYLFHWEGYRKDWECKLVSDDPADRRYYGYGDTPPRAITIAAILAKEK